MRQVAKLLSFLFVRQIIVHIKEIKVGKNHEKKHTKFKTI